MTLRPCLVRNKRGLLHKALFHKWIESKYVIEPSLMIGGTQGGQVCHNFGLIEYEDGVVSEVEPEQIIFRDKMFKDFAFPEDEK